MPDYTGGGGEATQISRRLRRWMRPRRRIARPLAGIRNIAVTTALLQGDVRWKRALDDVDEADLRSHHKAWSPMPE